MFKWQICYTEMTNLLQFTINIRKSHRPPQRTLQIKCEDRVLFVWVDLRVQNTIEQFVWCIHLSFVHSALHPTPLTNLMELDLEILVENKWDHHGRSIVQVKLNFCITNLPFKPYIKIRITIISLYCHSQCFSTFRIKQLSW